MKMQNTFIQHIVNSAEQFFFIFHKIIQLKQYKQSKLYLEDINQSIKQITLSHKLNHNLELGNHRYDSFNFLSDQFLLLSNGLPFFKFSLFSKIFPLILISNNSSPFY
ncbi:hypothetical protein pb186bvf_009761 [Paramecium bursaria]